MRWPRAIVISLAVTLVLTAILMYFFGPRALGLFLFLPIGFAFGRKKRDGSPHDQGPIEPR
jgi:hypothetical protein